VTPPLTPDQQTALRNLALKHAGEPVGFINIAQAQSLTELDLAVRNRDGWTITPTGLALAASIAANLEAAPTSNLTSLPTPIRKTVP
jgi:hypothetical protein